MPQRHTVFVSHAHSDNELCDRYVAALRERGLDMWYYRTSMQAGRSLSANIEYELNSRTAFIVMLTPASIQSYWVRLEIDAFRDLASRDPYRVLLPVRIVDCPVPLLLRGLKWIDASQTRFDAAVDEICRTLGMPSTSTPERSARQEDYGDFTILGVPLNTALKLVGMPAWSTYQLRVLSSIRGTVPQLSEVSRKRESEGNLENSIELQQVITLLAPTNQQEWGRLISLLGRTKRFEDQVVACLHFMAVTPDWDWSYVW